MINKLVSYSDAHRKELGVFYAFDAGLGAAVAIVCIFGKMPVYFIFLVLLLSMFCGFASFWYLWGKQ